MASARDIRETFKRMAMNDEETVALIAGGHTFGKTHGAADPDEFVGRSQRGAPMEQQGSRLEEQLRHRQGWRCDHQRSGGIWTNNPTGGQRVLRQPVRHEWELTKSPAGANQWTPKNPEAQGTVPDAHDPSKRHAPTMRRRTWC